MIRRSEFFTVLALLVMGTRTFAQVAPPTATYDFFPLEVGRQWTYSFTSLERTYESLIQLAATRDSGLVSLTVGSWSDQDSVISWHILEQDSIWRQYDCLYDDKLDTTYWIVQTRSCDLLEWKSESHKIGFTSEFPVFWAFTPVPFAEPLSDSLITSWRFARYDSSVNDRAFSFSALLYVFGYSHSLLLRNGIGAVSGAHSVAKGPNTLYYFEANAELLSTIVSVSEVEGNSGTEALTVASFPNPFNDETSIFVSLPSGASISLRLFDMLGRQVYDVANQHLPRGDHRFQIQANNLPSGIYFCVFRSTRGTRVTRLILTR